MRIFYFGKFGPHNTESYIAEALKNAGHSVFKAPEYGYKHPNQIKADIEAYNADILLFAKANPIFDFQRVLDIVEVPKICWMFDLFFDAPANLNRSLNKPYLKADVVFSTDGGHDKEWSEHGIVHETVRQGIHAPHYRMLDGEKTIDVSFIGSSSYPYRYTLHNFLKERYNYERRGLTEEVRGMDLNLYLSTVKVVVGDSVPTPHYWSNRLYEITGRGGFMIFPEIEGLKDEFPDIPTYTWGNLEELKEKVDYYLENEDEREEIRTKCFEKCGEYTYDARVKEFIWKLKKYLD